MRRPIACARCRGRRVKCRQSDRADGPCAGCKKHNFVCSLTDSQTASDARGSSRRIEPAAVEEALSPDHGPQVQKMVDDYIYYIHDRPHSLFHEPSLRQSVAQCTMSKALLSAICALGCRFSTDEDIRAMRTSYLARAKTLFHAEIEGLSVSSLQTCLLIAQCIGAESQTGIECVYFGMAHRMAQLISLHQSRDPFLTNIDREISKRIRLSIFTADRWHSAGYGVPFLVHVEDLPTEPAVDELVFLSPQFNEVPSIQKLEPGLWALRTQLATMLGEIQQLMIRLASQSEQAESLDAKVKSILQDLRTWHMRLPSRFLLNKTNVEIYKSNGKGGSFVDLFLGYNYYCTLLLFHSLGRQPPSATPRHEHAELCHFYALEFASVLKLARSEPGCHAVHYTVGHMTVVSSSALLYFLLSLSETAHEKAHIREALLSNFSALEELETYWPTAKRWVERLTAFHHACSEWTLTEPFAMNRWMIRFLLEYALPLEAKEKDGMVPSVSDLDRSASGVCGQKRTTESLIQLL